MRPYKSSKLATLVSQLKFLLLKLSTSASFLFSQTLLPTDIYLFSFCTGSDDSALTPFIPRIAKDLGPFLLVTSEDTLSLVLETLAVVVEVDKGKWLTQELASALVVSTLEVWNKNNKDPIFLSIFPDIINSLAASAAPGIYETIVQQAMPPLCNAISSASPDQGYISGSAIELVGAIVRAASATGPGGGKGLGDNFFDMLAPNLFKCLGEVEDRDVLQVCTSLLFSFLLANLNSRSHLNLERHILPNPHRPQRPRSASSLARLHGSIRP